jgi:hypothetical protein
MIKKKKTKGKKKRAPQSEGHLSREAESRPSCPTSQEVSAELVKKKKVKQKGRKNLQAAVIAAASRDKPLLCPFSATAFPFFIANSHATPPTCRSEENMGIGPRMIDL